MVNVTYSLDDISSAITEEVDTALYVLHRATYNGLRYIDNSIEESFDTLCIDILLLILLFWSCASCVRVSPRVTTGQLVQPAKHEI